MSKKILIIIGCLGLIIAVPVCVFFVWVSSNLFINLTDDEQCYKISGDEVYLEYDEFDQIEDWFPKKKEILVEGADADSFTDVESLNCIAFEWSSDLTFSAIGKDKDNVYIGVKVAPGIDPEGFQSLENKTPFNFPSFFKNSTDVYYYDTLEHDLNLLDLDPSEVVVLDDGYIKDNTNVYRYGVLIEGADGVTFKIFENDNIVFFSTDGDSIFYKHHKLLNAYDPPSWELLSTYYSKDDLKVYYLYDDEYPSLVVVKEADPSTFVSAYQLTNSKYEYSFNAEELPYGRDSRYVFYRENEVPGADANGLTPINKYFWHDGKNVYFKTLKVEGANPNTFETQEFSTVLGKDRKTGEEYDGRDLDALLVIPRN